MSKLVIAVTVAAGNATDATVFTMPAGFQGFVSSLTCSNTTGGSLNLTLKLTRVGTTFTLLAATAVGASSAAQFNKGATNPVFPITLNAGDILLAQGSGAGLNVTVSGVRYSVDS